MITQLKHRLKSIKDKVLTLPAVSLDELGVAKDHSFELVSDRINMPSEFRPEFDHDDLVPMLQLIKASNPKVILELGTAYGTTTANILMNHDCKVYTVNALPEQIEGEITTFALTKEEIGEVYRKYGLEGKVEQIYANTLELDLSPYMGEERAQFAIIDACHDTDFVINDFNKVKPFLDKDAIVLFHDTHPSQKGHLRGSYQACLKLRGKGFNVKHLEDTWWGVWVN